MACFHPLKATRLNNRTIIVHKRFREEKPTPEHLGRDMKLPCGRCTGCRLERSKQWAVRLMCEAQLHEKNSFLTLTYNDETLHARRPPRAPKAHDGDLDKEPTPTYDVLTSSTHGNAHRNWDSLVPKDVQLFMKRLRFNINKRNPSTRVRFYSVGEYGERFQRPHYHIALFGEDFSDDRYPWRAAGQYNCYRSSRLESLWTYGNSEIGELTLESAQYVASYVMKKINGEMAHDHYRREDPETGEIFYLQPEFAHMSRGGSRGRGIAYQWFAKYQNDVYPQDFYVHNNKKLKPPRYFDKLLEQIDPVQMEVVRLQREYRAQQLAEDNTPQRLADKELICKKKLELKKRNLETI